jgi:anti-sigma-K factor RskA
MTEPHNTDHTAGCGGDVAAYVLDALEAGEARSFGRHLDTCVVCRDELASFQQVVDVLPLSASRRRAPDSLRRRVRAGVRREARLAARASRHRRPPATLRRPALALGSIVVAVCIAIGVVALASPNSAATQTYSAQVTGSSGTAQLRVVDGAAKLVVRDLRPPPRGHIYEVWLVSGRRPRPTTALFSVNSRGDGDVDVPGGLRGVQRVLVTPEPMGGSNMPTHAPVISARLT